VVVTLPLAVLQRGAVAFDPPLPAAKAAALGALGVGSVTKVLARLRPGSEALDPRRDTHGELPAPARGAADMRGSNANNDNADRGADVVEYFMVDLPGVERLGEAALTRAVDQVLPFRNAPPSASFFIVLWLWGIAGNDRKN
jgi:hypothetical protein